MFYCFVRDGSVFCWRDYVTRTVKNISHTERILLPPPPPPSSGNSRPSTTSGNTLIALIIYVHPNSWLWQYIFFHPVFRQYVLGSDCNLCGFIFILLFIFFYSSLFLSNHPNAFAYFSLRLLLLHQREHRYTIWLNDRWVIVTVVRKQNKFILLFVPSLFRIHGLRAHRNVFSESPR